MTIIISQEPQPLPISFSNHLADEKDVSSIIHVPSHPHTSPPSPHPTPFSPQWIAGHDGSNLILNSVFQMRATGGMITLMRMGVGEKVNPAALTRKRSWAIPMQRTDTEKHMMVSREKVSRCLFVPRPLTQLSVHFKVDHFSLCYIHSSADEYLLEDVPYHEESYW